MRYVSNPALNHSGRLADALSTSRSLVSAVNLGVSMRFGVCSALVVLVFLSSGCDEEPQIRTQKAATTYPFEFEQPTDWRRTSTPKLSERAMRMGITPPIITLFAENDRVEISVTTLAGDGGGLSANVNRWRRQNGLPPQTEDEVKQAVQPIEIDGLEGSFVDLVATEGDNPERTIGVILPRDDKTWFFKMKGPKDEATAQKDNFDKFIQSIEFNGANDG